MTRFALRLSALNGLLAVALGAFAAHAVADPQAQGWLRTGAQYQMVHAVAALAVAGRSPWAARLFAVGALVFAAALYGLAAGLPRWLGAVAPIGGTLMIAGWAALLVSLFRSDRGERPS